MHYLKYVFQNNFLIIPIIFCQFSMSALYLNNSLNYLPQMQTLIFQTIIFYSLRAIGLIILKLNILEGVSEYTMSNSLSCKVISLKTVCITLEAKCSCPTNDVCSPCFLAGSFSFITSL